MKYCDKCKITIQTNQPYCPLCHQILKGKSGSEFQETYPDTISVRRMFFPTTKKILKFITVLSIIILVVINWANFNGNYWSLIPIGAIVYFWFLVRFGVFSRRNIAFRLATLTILLIGLLIFIDFDSSPENNGWSLNYLLPFLLLSSNLAIAFIIWIKRLEYRDYFFYLLVIIFFSLAPFILVLVKVITVIWPALAALGAAVTILLFIIFFFPKAIKEEIKKKFHA